MRAAGACRRANTGEAARRVGRYGCPPRKVYSPRNWRNRALISFSRLPANKPGCCLLILPHEKASAMLFWVSASKSCAACCKAWLKAWYSSLCACWLRLSNVNSASFCCHWAISRSSGGHGCQCCGFLCNLALFFDFGCLFFLLDALLFSLLHLFALCRLLALLCQCGGDGGGIGQVSVVAFAPLF